MFFLYIVILDLRSINSLVNIIEINVIILMIFRLLTPKISLYFKQQLPASDNLHWQIRKNVFMHEIWEV